MRLLLIGSRLDAVLAAKQTGNYVILFEQKERITEEVSKVVDELHIIDWEEINLALSLAQQIHENEKLDAVFSFGERGTVTSSYISSKLKVKGNNLKSILMSHNKGLLRKHLNQKRISYVNYEICDNMVDIKDSLLKIGFPCIVKPIKGTGSRGVIAVNSLEDFIDKSRDRSVEFPVIIEEQLKGIEISVEALSVDKKHHIIALTKKTTTGAPNFLEVQHEMPFKINKTDENIIYELVKKVLDTIELDIGPSHTEIILTEKGPKVIETHARPGGDNITELIKLSFGIDVYEETYKHLSNSNYKVTSINQNKYSLVKYLFFPQGKLVHLDGIKEASKIAKVELYITQNSIIKTPSQSKERHGYYIVSANTRQELEKLTKKVENYINYKVESV